MWTVGVSLSDCPITSTPALDTNNTVQFQPLKGWRTWRAGSDSKGGLWTFVDLCGPCESSWPNNEYWHSEQLLSGLLTLWPDETSFGIGPTIRWQRSPTGQFHSRFINAAGTQRSRNSRLGGAERRTWYMHMGMDECPNRKLCIFGMVFCVFPWSVIINRMGDL